MQQSGSVDGEGRYPGVEDFITGRLTRDGESAGRPAGIMIWPEGTIFVSNDKAGVICRISRKSPEAAH